MATVVIRSRAENRITGEYIWEYRQVKAWRDGAGALQTRAKKISKHDAEKSIEKLGLKVMHSTADGQVFDTLNGDFRRLFPGGLHNWNEIEKINKIDKL